jgi:beta-galactosidase/beta-glucuronidase
MPTPRPEYPRPDLVRSDWHNLNGEWQFAFDDLDTGMQAGWTSGHEFDARIIVPYCYQSPMSGVHTRDFHHILWYRRFFEVPHGWYGRRVRVNFGAVDYEAWVYINGHLAATHRGGHTPFSADITKFLNDENKNEIVVRVFDGERVSQPRGKQSEKYESSGITYSRTSGIWQTVWLEPVGILAIKRVRINSWNLDGHVSLEVLLDRADPRVRVVAEAMWEQNVVASAEAGPGDDNPNWLNGYCVKMNLQIPKPQPWSVRTPNLYGLRLTVRREGTVMDNVQSYFGIRSLEIHDGVVLLNGVSLYQRLVLDQGYWPDGIMTAPSDEALKNDILYMQEMGFNGCRKHMKLEDPRFLYWADKLGYLVWGEMAAAYDFSDAAIQNYSAEWQEAVVRDRNHPCIITWTPINESWGVDRDVISQHPEQIAYLDSLYHLTRALDPSRPVNGNDGWQNPMSDLATIHDYTQEGFNLRERLEAYVHTPTKAAFAHGYMQHLPGHPYRGQPILVTEYGGIALVTDDQAWGYGRAAHSPEELLARYADLTSAIQSVRQCMGYCYTQLCDVEQEQNGLYTYDRKPKVDPLKVREINEHRTIV